MKGNALRLLLLLHSLTLGAPQALRLQAVEREFA